MGSPIIIEETPLKITIVFLIGLISVLHYRTKNIYKGKYVNNIKLAHHKN